MESSHSRLRPRRRARLASAVLAALGVAVFGLGALPAQEAQAAAGSAPTARRDGRQA
jgi:hypothetical protein